MNKTDAYLGDGLYASFDGYWVELYTWNGETETNTVFLDPDVLVSFHQYIHDLTPRKGDT